MMAPADGGRAELDRALVDLWGALEEARLKLIDLLARGPVLKGRDHLRARLREDSRILTYLQRGIGELRRGLDHCGTDQHAANQAASK